MPLTCSKSSNGLTSQFSVKSPALMTERVLWDLSSTCLSHHFCCHCSSGSLHSSHTGLAGSRMPSSLLRLHSLPLSFLSDLFLANCLRLGFDQAFPLERCLLIYLKTNLSSYFCSSPTVMP